MGLRGFLYALGMVYFFIGVSIVSDLFMGSIEAITSRRTQHFLPNGKISTTRIWNDTVANLTLMALGSSAPEILLSVIELFKRDMSMGELGPQTIVGSASFNLFMIVGLCIMVIPSTESRQVRQTQVFAVTTVFMFFAYLWLVMTISVSTPGVVDIWEALVTLLALPVLVSVSYLSDIGMLDCRKQTHGRNRSVIESEDIQKLLDLLGQHDRDTREACKVALALRPKRAPPLSELTHHELEQIRKQVIKSKGQKKSRAARRVEATRALTGGRKIPFELTATWTGTPQVAGVTGASLGDIPIAAAKGTGNPTIQFASAAQTLSSELSSKEVIVKREGVLNNDISVIVYYTVSPITNYVSPFTTTIRNSLMRNSGLRKSGSSMAMKQVSMLELGPKETSKIISVPVPSADDSAVIGFTVDMIGLEVQGSTLDDDPSSDVTLGTLHCTEVEIGRSEFEGVLGFSFDHVMTQGLGDPQTLEIMVQRQGGCSGTASCTFRTERLTAIPGHDYEEIEGELVFEEGVTEQFIEIKILPKGKRENKDDFLIVLENAEGVTFKPNHDGGEDMVFCTVTIAMLTASDQSRYGNFLRSMDRAMNFDALRLGNSEWKEAWASAVYCNGSPEEQKEASTADWVFHIIALPWKLLFCLIPPTAYFHGWLCFWVSLLFIGLCTAFIGDLAELFGCVVQIDDTITAILFVALGTSMPDLFASRTAATQDPFADASIINVTGSNSVNVFLGLGLPWTIGAIYWAVTGRTSDWTAKNPIIALELGPDEAVFTAPTRGLAFSVLVFSVGAVVAIFLLIVRRKVVGAELGGPMRLKVLSFITFVSLWLSNVGVVSWYTIRWDQAPTKEKVAVLATVFVVILTMVTAVVVVGVKAPARHTSEAEQDNCKGSHKDERLSAAAREEGFKASV